MPIHGHSTRRLILPQQLLLRLLLLHALPVQAASRQRLRKPITLLRLLLLL